MRPKLRIVQPLSLFSCQLRITSLVACHLPLQFNFGVRALSLSLFQSSLSLSPFPSPFLLLRPLLVKTRRQEEEGGVQLRAHCNVLALPAVAEEECAVNANDRRWTRRGKTERVRGLERAREGGITQDASF